ncbi:MAG TPA: DUF898 family protein [Xanthobacteraceae bacterium]|jgi:uncharacterized membrane protein YjgN (DUF898 family)|nr:DUF898 family protein [Xanthobacteraceae bacterium]
MTAAEASIASADAVQFLGKETAYWRLRIKGAALLMLTLGLYRFWFATDVRRFLWCNTEIAGDTLEYTGIATELLVGFLLAIAILVPLYTTFAIGALELTARAPIVVVAGLITVALLGEFALYRARRYRLTRTVFRGVQFDQHGAAWRYALYALLWWSLAVVTLGLAYPWAQASLQRFKMERTCYGDLAGAFAGTGVALFLRGLPLWLAVVGPIVFAFFALGALIDWNTLNTAVTQGDQATLAFIETSSGFRRGVGIAFLCGAIAALAAVLLYPLFQAISLRWWISGLRFGDVAVRSRLKTGQVYRVYLRFLLYIFLLMLATALAGGICLFAVSELVGPRHDSTLAELLATIITVGLYVVIALGASTVHQVVVTFSLWRLGLQSAEVTGAEALNSVRAAGAPSSALGEGLADALGVGGI